MSQTKDYGVLRSCVASDGRSIAKGATVSLTAEQAVLWAQAGKIEPHAHQATTTTGAAKQSQK